MGMFELSASHLAAAFLLFKAQQQRQIPPLLTPSFTYTHTHNHTGIKKEARKRRRTTMLLPRRAHRALSSTCRRLPSLPSSSSLPPSSSFDVDVLVCGAGVVGLAIARALAR